MIPHRRLTFQLMPLLDLLLIVFFAQYVEMQTLMREESGRLRASQQSLTAELDEALHQLISLQQQLTALDQVKSERDSLTEDLNRVRFQRDRIGEMVVELFRVPEAAIDQLLQEAKSGQGPTGAEARQLKQKWQQLAGDRQQDIVEHLLTFHELRKRCDLWDLYIQDDGLIVLTVNGQRQALRAEDATTFADRLFEAYKALPQPKSLVLILVSYGDARLGVRQAVLDGLPGALERIRADDESRSRYDFAVLGFRPETAQKGRS